jgi:hypothetical protein
MFFCIFPEEDSVLQFAVARTRSLFRRENMQLGKTAGLLLLVPVLAMAQPTNGCREIVNAQGTLPGLTNRAPVTFNIKAQTRGENIRGRASYVDREAGLSFVSSNLTDYVVMDEFSRTLTFEARDTNGVPISATFVICDFGRRTNDVIAAVINNEYERTSHLRRGKVTLKRHKCPSD